MLLFTFTNNTMADDIVDPKTNKVKVYKTIVLVSDNEHNARKKAYRRDIDKDSELDSSWELVSAKQLSKDWR